MIHAVRAALLAPEWGPKVIPPPHDALTPEERRLHLAAHPDSFMHVTRSAAAGHGHPTEHRRLASESDEVLQRLLAAGAYGAREEPRLYVQRIEAAVGVQHALVGAIRHGERKLIPHERTHPGRVRALAANFGLVGTMSSPVVVTSRPSSSERSLIDAAVTGTPLRELVASDGTRITLWDAGATGVELAGDLYIVDGHHRVAAAAEARFDQLLVAYVPPEELCIDSFDRLIGELAVMPRRVAELLQPYCDMVELDPSDGSPPARPEPGELLLAVTGHLLLARRRRVDSLDVRFVHDVVLPEVFGVSQPGDPRLGYQRFTGSTGSGAIDSPRAVISTAPLGLEAVLDIADRGDALPPKTTCFVPKARSGILLVPC